MSVSEKIMNAVLYGNSEGRVDTRIGKCTTEYDGFINQVFSFKKLPTGWTEDDLKHETYQANKE